MEQEEFQESTLKSMEEENDHELLNFPQFGMLERSEQPQMAFSLQNPRDALAVNRMYQELLLDQLRRVEQAQQRNEELQKKIRVIVAKQGKHKKSVLPGLSKKFGAPYFVDIDNQKPPDNPDTLRKKEIGEEIPTTFKQRKWSEQDKKSLLQEIRHQNQQRLMEEVIENFNQTGSTDLEGYNREMEKIRNMSDFELESDTSEIDWEKIAKAMQRSVADCRIEWKVELDPTVNREPWTKEEEKKLLELAKKHQGHNWEQIAEELGTHRHPVHCFVKYQRGLNPNMIRGEWTEEEDALLTEAVKLYGEKNWQQVASCLEGRTGQQCLHRWQKTVNPNIRKGRWSKDEDIMLALAVNAYPPGNWIKVKQHVPGRTDVQCRERYVNVLDPAVSKQDFSKEEDEKLNEAVQKYGLGKWSQIAQEMTAQGMPRTDNQCWRRWKMLNTQDVEEYKKKVYKRKKGMVNNFAGRVKERTSLTPDDIDLEIPDFATKKKAPTTTPRKRKKTTPEEQSDTILQSIVEDNVVETPNANTNNVQNETQKEVEVTAIVEHSDEEDCDNENENTTQPVISPKISLDFLIPEHLRNNEGVDVPSITMVKPSMLSFTAAHRLLETLYKHENKQKTAEGSSTDTVNHSSHTSLPKETIHSTNFQLFASCFNSMFLWPMFVWAESQSGSSNKQ